MPWTRRGWLQAVLAVITLRPVDAAQFGVLGRSVARAPQSDSMDAIGAVDAISSGTGTIGATT